MIIIKLQGGLGNQMFQYAIGRSLSKKINKKLKLDISHYRKNKDRKYNLNVFNITTEIANLEEINSFKKFKISNKRIIGKIHNTLFADKTKYILENRFNFIHNISNIKKDVYLEGFWQTQKYFIDIKNTIKKDFTIKKPSKEYQEKIPLTENSVSIHVRRGDYINNKKTLKYHGICSLNYYNEAIRIIKIKIKNPTFFIFSDDINWVKKNLKTNAPTIFVSNGKLKDYEELILMSKCKHNIIANSSFGWWGAWLNNNPNKIIIAPKQWFKTKKMNTVDLIPDSWIKI